MRDPKIVVGLSETGERDAIVVKRTDGQGVLHYVAWELSQVENEGYMALCVKVGNAVLRMLAGAHEDTFQNYSLVMPPKPVDADVEGIVLHLIHMTHKQKTKAYVATIDELIRRNSTEFENSSIPESWSNLRIAALSFPD